MKSLKEIIREANISYNDICLALSIRSAGTVSLKVNGKANFTTKEASNLKKLINERTGKKYSLEDLFPE